MKDWTLDDIALRPARREDAPAIAALFLIASDGLARYIWSRIDMPGKTLEEIGAARYAREGVAFSYQNCLVAEHEGRVVGMLHSFAMNPPEAPETESDPVLRPYAELEDYGSLYISGLAVLPAYRGRGLGRRLLLAAHERAKAIGRPRVSLICFEANANAMRLYRSEGYRELDRRAVVPHPDLHYTDGDAVLLARDLD
jgi:ribosomal protein S18 acetylase RimI-like enzyme